MDAPILHRLRLGLPYTNVNGDDDSLSDIRGSRR
jgi:hypothetical protein